MRKKKKENAKDVVLPHSKAKLDLYENYLINYLRVLSLSPYFDKINLFDIYCGVGIYKDGNVGSPIITNKCIRQINDELGKMSKPLKEITVNINDYDAKKVLNVETHLSNDKLSNCSYVYTTNEADLMLEIVAKKVNSYSNRERNLIFIDPYGYSDIDKNKIYRLLQNEYTEVILFLPVSQMYRFADKAMTDEEKKCYDNLRKFINSFLSNSIVSEYDNFKSVFDFINELKEALSFNSKFYTCSHYIQRGGGNYNALFFITSNIYGLEKMIEAKWKLDPTNGEGFKQIIPQISMFEQVEKEEEKNRNISSLKKLITDFITKYQSVNNVQLYKLCLTHEFQPTQTIKALDELIKSKKIKIADNTINPIGKYINYRHFKENIIKATFVINKI
ncbi:MAG TPA: three-Cys-motif partner protein TcmP [Chitinophagales bacterium]|nr:three-Cys-motif partner protein TcmP [Chitinophagales bacterium]